MKTLLATSILIAVALPGLRAATVLPVPPAELLSLLAGPPDGWEMKKSQADTVFSGNLVATATRVFEEIPQPDATGAEPEAQLGRLTIQLMDTGRAADRTAMFASATGEFAGYPAMSSGTGDSQTVTLLVAQRFLLSVAAADAPTALVAKWTTDCAKQIAAAAGGLTSKPAPDGPMSYTSAHVDELDPTKSRSHEAGTAGAVELEITE